MRFYRWPLAWQFSLGVFVLVAAIITALAAAVALKTRYVLTEQAHFSQDTQVEVLASQLQSAYSTIVKDTHRLATIFAELYSAPLLFADEATVTVGNYQSPLVTHRGEQVNLNYTLVDQFSRMTGGNATVFIRMGEDFLRVTTSLKNEQGKRATGTMLGSKHPGYQTLMRGDVYTGEARLFGVDYMTEYTPVVDDSGRVIAVLYVGFPVSELMAELRENLNKAKFGDLGHASLVYNETSPFAGKLLADPDFVGEQVSAVYQQSEFQRVLKQGSGVFDLVDADYEGGVHVRYQQVGDGPWSVFALNYQSEYAQQINNLVLMLMALALVAIAIVVPSMMMLSNHRLKGLHEVAAVVERFGRGDFRGSFTKPAVENSRNEVERLKFSVSKMQQNISHLIAEVRLSGDQVQQASLDISGSSNEVYQAAQASSSDIVQVSSSISEIAASIQVVADNVNSVSAQSESTYEMAQSGQQSVASVSSSINQLKHEFGLVTSVINQLEQDSEDIGNVVEVIDSVAEQTNLLALNAAIEAARAGEQGRGFAVVADEVRTLAQRVQSSTHEIQQVVQKLQENAGKAQAQVHASASSVDESVSRASDAANQLDEIKLATEQVRERMVSVASTTEQQSAAAEQISQTSQSLIDSSKQTAEQAKNSSTTSASMSEQAEQLKRQVGQFNVA